MSLMLPMKALALALASASLLAQATTSATPTTGEVSGVISLIAQLRDLGLIGFLIAVVLVQYRDKKEAEKKKDDQLEKAATNSATVAAALQHNTESNIRLTDSIHNLELTLQRSVSPR